MLFALACAGSLVAQNASQQISGFVRDSTGAVIPAVRVTAIQPDTGLTRAVASNESGYYVISNIPIGIYYYWVIKLPRLGREPVQGAVT
jgi:hypothetical protein